MTKLTYLLLGITLAISHLYSATYYVDSQDGNDGWAGTQSNPWQSLSKVNSASLNPGDQVRLRRDRTFNIDMNGPLVARSGVYYGAYGSGEKPKITFFIRKNSSADWTNIGENLWETAAPMVVGQVYETGNILFGESLYGVLRWDQSANDLYAKSKLQSAKDYTVQYPPNANELIYNGHNYYKVTVYSNGNPANVFSDIKLCLKENLLRVENVQNVTIRDLHFTTGGAHGVHMANVSDVTIRNCDFSWLGGGQLWPWGPMIRYGNAAELWDDGHDIEVSQCRFWEIHDTAFTDQHFTGQGSIDWSMPVDSSYNSQGKRGPQYSDHYNIYFRNCLVWDCGMAGYEAAKDIGKYYNVYIENNTFYNIGGGWSASQRGWGGFVMAFHQNYSDAPDDCYNIVVRNNIMHTAPYGFLYGNNDDAFRTWDRLEVDNNLYWTDDANPGGALYAWIIDEEGMVSMDNWDTIRNSRNWDWNSLKASPQWMNKAAADFRLNTGSPAIDAGALNGLSEDFVANARIDSIDIGVYEFPNGESVYVDDVISVTSVDTVEAGGSITAQIQYEASARRDLRIFFQLDQSPYTIHGEGIVNVSAGTGTANVYIPVDGNTPSGSNYKILAFLTTENGGWGEKLDYMQRNGISVTSGAGGGVVDDIISVSGPSAVPYGGQVSVNVSYESTTSRDVIVWVQLDHSPWTIYGSQRIDVASGVGSLTANINVDSSIPIGSGYKYLALITTDGGGWDQRFDDVQQTDITVVSGGGSPTAKAYYKSTDSNGSNNIIRPYFRIQNTSIVELDLSKVELRYYYTRDSSKAQGAQILWAQNTSADVSCVSLSPVKTEADYYLKNNLRFQGCWLRTRTTQIETQVHNADWSNYVSEDNDYSHDASETEYVEWDKVTLLYGWSSRLGGMSLSSWKS